MIAEVRYNTDPQTKPDRRWEVFMWGRRICCCIDRAVAEETAYLLNLASAENLRP